MARPIWLRWFLQAVLRPCALAFESVGRSKAARSAMMPHVHAEVVQAPEKDVRGHRAVLQDLQEQFAGRLNDNPRHQGRERFVSGGGSPAVLIGRLLGVGEGFNGRRLPGNRISTALRGAQCPKRSPS